MRKTARKTTSNSVSQTTIDEFFHKDNADDDTSQSKRLKDDKHAFTTATMDNERPEPIEWVTPPPDPYPLAETKSKRLNLDTHTIDTNAFTISSRTRSDDIAETINLIDETIAMCKDDIPGSINMIVDSGASHVLVRQEHAHVLQNIIFDNSKNELCNNQMRLARSYPHSYRHGFTHHRAIPHPGLHLSQPRVTTLIARS